MSVNQYKHELLFESLGHTDWLEICEPIGFDGAYFSQVQDAKRYGRDVSFLDVDKLSFVESFGHKLDTPRILNPQGDLTQHADYCLPFHFETIKEKGFESVTKYRISLNGVHFKEFTLDYSIKDLTDGYSYVNCMVLDNNNVADFKRNFDTKFNALGTKDVKDNTITPIPTFNYLRKATPLNQTNILEVENSTLYLQNYNSINQLATTFANIGWNLKESQIESTLGFFPDMSVLQTDGSYLPPIENFNIIRAKNDLSNITIEFKLNVKFKIHNDNGVPARARLQGHMVVGDSVIDNLNTANDYVFLLSDPISSDGSFPTEYNYSGTINISIPYIDRDKRLFFFFTQSSNSKLLVTSTNFIGKNTITINAVSTAIDVVIKASRYLDLIKQSSKFINNLLVNAPLFDNGGVHYDQAVFCRNMITQGTYFYTTPKDVLESVMEVNCDYEISEQELFIGRDKDYYKNVEIGIFAINPDAESNMQFNEKLMINNFKYGYSKYAQDRVIVGTDQSIHTDSEWIVPNLKSENKKEISNKFVRDGKYIQDLINIEIKTPTTTTQNDDDVLVEDMVALPPNSFGTFGARLLMRWQNGNLEILNRDSNGDSSDVVINWLILGLAIGSSFQVTNGVNVGTYTIVSLTNSVITLTPTTAVSTFDGDAFVKFKYFYNNVNYQTRLGQGFLLPTSVTLPNIAYSIKRNVKYFSGYLASCMLYAKSKLRNTYFKGNGTFASQLYTETTSLVENADYFYTDFDAPIIGAETDDLTLVATFEQVNDYLTNYRTNKGFIRCLDNLGNVVKGFVKDLKFSWLTNEFKVTIERVYEPQILMLTYENGVLNVNDVPYNLSGVSDWWKFENDYVKFYDEKSRAICNFYKYNLVNLNGITYSSRLDLENALLTL